MGYQFTFPRSAWVPPSPKIVGLPIDLAQIDTIVHHYTSADNVPDGDPGEPDSAIAARLRAANTDYWNNRGFSLGYSAAWDYLGRSYESRGLDLRCAANSGPFKPDVVISSGSRVVAVPNARQFEMMKPGHIVRLGIKFPNYVDLDASVFRILSVDAGSRTVLLDRPAPTSSVRAKMPVVSPHLNVRTLAMLHLVDGASPMTGAATAGVADFIDYVQNLLQRQLLQRGHGELDATGCPGVGIQNQIHVGETAVPYPSAEVPSPITGDTEMLIVVGRKEAPQDPRRWVWNGVTVRWIRDEEEFWRLYKSDWALFKLHPNFSTLAAPYLMTDAELRSYGEAHV